MKTPLINLSGYHHIARGESQRKVSEWVSYSENINALDSWGRNAAHWAARNGYLEILIEFKCFGINLDQQDLKKQTPLHLAAKKGHIAVLKFLMSHQVKQTPDTKGRYPLHIATFEAFKELVVLGANLNVLDHKGRDPFKALKNKFKRKKIPDLELHGFMKKNVDWYTMSL